MEEMTKHIAIIIDTLVVGALIIHFNWGGYTALLILMTIAGWYFYIQENTESKAPPNY